MTVDYDTFATGFGTRSYEVGTSKIRFIVHADTRTQASAIVKRAGYIVRDVNLVG